MKVSVFTPTHNPRWLYEAYLSLRGSGYDEWLVVLNNGVRVSDVHADILCDRSVRVVAAPDDIGTNIGALKRYACSQCTGDILLELDHDDLLVPEVLSEVRASFMRDPSVVLVHSNWCEVEADSWKPVVYGPEYGWKWYGYSYQGHDLKCLCAPEQNAYTASSMYWGPNHLRAFRRAAYEQVFGHDPKMSVADDLDLICRLWMVGNFHHIESCGYIYRRHEENTWRARSAQIHSYMATMRPKYFRAMVEAAARRNGELMIDLGGRFNCPAGYKSVDTKGGDFTADLAGRYPFDDSSVGVVRASDFLEHVADKMHSLREIHRVLKPGGFLLSDTPSTTGPNGEAGQGADQDPTHVSRWNRNAFWYVTRSNVAKYVDNTTVRFLPVTLENYWPGQWQQENFIPYVRADLICLKDGYRPHGYLEF